MYFHDDRVFDIHQVTLTDVGKTKSFDKLHELGGVSGEADGLETIVECGIGGESTENKKIKKGISPSASYTALNVFPDDNDRVFNIHQVTLTEVGKTKSFDKLHELGGVSGEADGLEMIVERGISGESTENKKIKKGISPSASYTALNVFPDENDHVFDIHQVTLTEVGKTKSFDKLHELGGVSVEADGLETIVERGICRESTENKKIKKGISPSASYTARNVFPDDNDRVFNIHQITLTEVGKTKSFDKLHELGGVSRVADGLKTNVERGIIGGSTENKNIRKGISPSPSYTALNVFPNDDDRVFDIHQVTLTEVGKTKSFDKLHELGGVSGEADGLETIVERGISGESMENKKIKKGISPSAPYTALNVFRVFDFHQVTLTEVGKTKSFDKLHELGGVSRVADGLKTNVEHGISGESKDIALRKVAFGENTYKKPLVKSFFYFVVEAFKDLTIGFLLVCAALSVGVGIKEHGLKEGWHDGGSILIAVFLVNVVCASSNFRQNRQFNKLSKVRDNIQIDVVRSGRRQQVSIFDLVVGDVVVLKIGDQVPSDGLFIGGHSLKIDESSMTGESEHIEINREFNPFLVSGTKVADGYGQMLVTSVGMNTRWGEQMSHISLDTAEKTWLQVRLNTLTSSIGKVGLAMAFLVLVVLLVRYFTGSTEDECGNRDFNARKTRADDIVNAVVGIVAAVVTIVVVANPEGLALAVTSTLAYSMKKMMADQALVRKLSACETMGSATIICTNKTGTLTNNLMKVTKIWLGHKAIEEKYSSFVSPNVLDLIKDGVALNTTGSVYKANSDSEFEFSGSPTEKAILSWAVMELKMDMEEVKQGCEILYVEAFNSKRKRSGILMKKKADNTIHVHWKGAAEMILAMCSGYYNASGMVKDMEDKERSMLLQVIQDMAGKSFRCIAFAHKQASKEEYRNAQAKKKINEDNLCLLGLVGIKDPCRPGVKKAIEDCQSAGVNIKMITGDDVFTARAIALECGILKPDMDVDEGAVVEGMEFRNYTPEERMEKVGRIQVMARSSTFDKLQMVQCLKQKGHVVAVTGGGTNDAPALKEADIGLSMGIQGTEVAKESSDIIILDDNFVSVARVLRWGRCVYDNIQKFIQLQLTVNVAALVINFAAAVSASEVPLTAARLLWVNLIMDTLLTLGALALAMEQPTNELTEKSPVGQTEPLITNIMWRNLLAQALYQITIILTLQFRGELIFDVTDGVNKTLVFNTFTLCQVFNEFNARKLEKKNVFRGIYKNKLFFGIIGVTILLQVLMVEFLKKFADTERLNWGEWGACIAMAAGSWPLAWVVKYIPVPEKPIFRYI